MSALLPVGTYVLVDDPGACDHVSREYVISPRRYYGLVVGYDLGRSKYNLATRYMGWSEYRFTEQGLAWAGPSWCTEVTEREAFTETPLQSDAHVFDAGAWGQCRECGGSRRARPHVRGDLTMTGEVS